MRIEDPDVPGDWWASGLTGSKALYEFFGRRPVSLEGAVCTKMHFEPFPRALWTIIELSDAPDPIPRNWSDWGYDAVCLRMGFLACRDVRVEGALPITGCSVALTPVGESTHLHLQSNGFELELTSTMASVLWFQSFTRGDRSTADRLHL